jgi:hypothetical protein
MTFERGRLERLLFWLSALTEHQATKQPICFERNRTGTAPSHCHGRVGCCRARRFPPPSRPKMASGVTLAQP